MAEEAGQSQRLEPVFGGGIDQLRVAGQQADDVVDLACRSRFEDRKHDRLVGQEGGQGGLVVVGGDEDRAESIFLDVQQTRVDDELAFHLVAVPLFDGVKK